MEANINGRPIDCADCGQPMSRDEAKQTMTGCCITCTAKADKRRADMDAKHQVTSGVRPVVGKRTAVETDIAMLILLAQAAMEKAS